MNTFVKIGKEIDNVAQFWGDRMPMMTMEECGELIQAISKYERTLDEVKNRNEKPAESDAGAQEDFDQETEKILCEARQGLVDEIGDMYISLMALRIHYGGSVEWSKDIEERIMTKLNKKY